MVASLPTTTPVELVLEALECCELFQSLEQPQKLAIARQCEFLQLPRNANLLEFGERSNSLLLIVSGRVQVLVELPNGRRVAFREAGPGDTIGEFSAIDGRPRSADVLSLEKVSIAVMPQHEFSALRSVHASIDEILMRQLLRQVRELTARVVSLTHLSTAERLVQAVLQRATPDLRGGVLFPRCNQSQLASEIGARREEVNRIIQKWRRTGLFHREADGDYIPDIGQLPLGKVLK